MNTIFSFAQKIRRIVSRALVCLYLLPFFGQALFGQENLQTSLLADRIDFNGEQLIAQGNVEVFYGRQRLQAQKIIYTRQTGQLNIAGPLEIIQDDGETRVLASSAEIDQNLENGILKSAELIIAQKLRASADLLDLKNKRYTRLQNAVASTCEVCKKNPTPIWEVRAKEILHDRYERKLLFTSAQLRIANIPVLWLPKLSLPDPTVKRANGFLLANPKYRSGFGLGIELPYFITIGDHKDLTLTPYIAEHSRTLGWRYRQENASGSLRFSGAVSKDSSSDDLRGYGFLRGAWEVAPKLTFGLDLKKTTDLSYLFDYEYYSRDRLYSRIWLEKHTSESSFSTEIIAIESLREAEVAIEDTLPFTLISSSYEQTLDTELPGSLSYGLNTTTAFRESQSDISGYDVARLGAFANWQHHKITQAGWRLDARAQFALDHYLTRQDSRLSRSITRATPAAAVKISYPLSRVKNGSGTEILSPFTQLSWAKTYGDFIPNNDSSFVEFDEGNLSALQRQPGDDRKANGLAFTSGIEFSSFKSNRETSLTFGKIVYYNPQNEFTDSSGLAGRSSDWLLSYATNLNGDTSFDTRILLKDDLKFSKWETRFDITKPSYDLSGTYNFILEDPQESRPNDIRELALNGRYKINNRLTSSASLLYDFGVKQAIESRLEFIYQTECAEISLGVHQSFADTSAIDPTTNYSLSFDLGSFENKRQARACNFTR